MNRLATAGTYNATTWGDAYVYDNWGNLLQRNPTQGTGESLQVTTDVHNHINTSGFKYDAAGNLTWDGANALKFDAENHMNPATGYVYSYDGDDLRVEKNYQGSITYYWYDDNANVISTTGVATNDYVYFAGRRIAFEDSAGNQHYYWSDHLGSAGVLTNSNGSAIQWEADYYPFGTKRVITNNLTNYYLFTGYQFDYETGYNYATHREQSPNLGRFMSPDPIGGDISNPQSLNRYSYVLNNPVNATDPLGLVCVWDDGSFDSADDPETGNGQGCESAGGTWFDNDWFASQGLGDWSPNPNSYLQGWVDLSQNGIPDATVTATLNSTPSDSATIGGVLSQVPETVSAYVPFVYGVGGITITSTYIPKTHTKCVGVAATVSTPAAKGVATGPLVNGNLKNAKSIVSGWGWNFNVQLSPMTGYQLTTNSSGTLGGPTVAIDPGLSASYGYTWCNE